MMGNSLIALLKFVAAGFSGSVTMLAEGVHSAADSANQALLLVGIVLSQKAGNAAGPVRMPQTQAMVWFVRRDAWRHGPTLP